VKPEEQDVVLELQSLELGESTLLFEFPGRHQGLPIELWIGGSPTSEQVLAPEADLEVSNLVAGQWRATVHWHGQPLLAPEVLALEDVKRLVVPLTPECVEGQTEEQWKRAGRDYPHGS
jgi:hypothetical protein